MTDHGSGGGGTKAKAKKLWDKGWDLTGRYIGEPTNRFIGRYGIESFWPTTTDKEYDKAARILRVFTLDGGVATTASSSSSSSLHHQQDQQQQQQQQQAPLNDPDEHSGKKTQRLLSHIPAAVLAQARGIAIFTVFRTGLHVSAASGSGVVLARLRDGSWSAPSGLLVHTIGVGFMVGVDVYDCVLVLNTDAAVGQFKRPRVKLGGEVSVAAGPVGEGRGLEASRAASWSYTKSKGFYAGVQLDGSVVIERGDENERFFDRRISAAQIMDGEVPRPTQAEGLYQVLAAAEGRDTRRDRIPKGSGPSEEHQTVPREAAQRYHEDAPPGYDEAVGQGQQGGAYGNAGYGDGHEKPSLPPRGDVK